MCVNISSYGEVAMPKPILNLFERYAVYEEQSGATMTKVVVAYALEAVFLHKLGKL
jgi:hypothetical protein